MDSNKRFMIWQTYDAPKRRILSAEVIEMHPDEAKNRQGPGKLGDPGNGGGPHFTGSGWNLRALLTAIAFAVPLWGFFALNMLTEPPRVSQSERRQLAALPLLSAEELVSGRFMKGFEGFAADSFVFRDGFRRAKSMALFGLFMQTDSRGLYISGSGAGKFERLDVDSAKKAAAKIGELAVKMEGLKVYYSIVPDKSAYSGRYFPGFDMDEALRIFEAELDGMAVYADVAGLLAEGDFYGTDLHWNQAGLLRSGGAVEGLGAAMGFDVGTTIEWKENRTGLFQGVYAGQTALPLRPDVMTFFTWNGIENVSAAYLNPLTGEMDGGPVYDESAFAGRDPYDLFLRGAQPFVVMDNPGAAAPERSLYIFRDSFASSLAPLLAAAYGHVALIDLRYIDSRMLPSLGDLREGSDVLFLYSSQILNNSSVLLVNPPQ